MRGASGASPSGPLKWVRKLLLPCAAAVAFTAAGCGDPPPAQDRPAAPPSAASPSSGPRDTIDAPALPAEPFPDREEFVLHGLSTTAATRAELEEALGRPDSIAAEIVPNRHVPGVLDTIFTIHYPDLTARIHRPGGGGELLSNVEVTSNRHLRYPAIGLPFATIDEAFGSPEEATDSSVTYYCTSCMGGDDPVRFVVYDGTVRRVGFGYYVD